MVATDEIRNLLGHYAELLDAGDFDAVAALFARATFGSTSRARPLHGVEQIRRLYDRVLLYEGIPRTRHVLSNIVIEQPDDAAGATSRCTFTVLQAAGRLTLQPILAGRYHDTFGHFDDGWWFTARQILPDWRGQIDAHWALAP